MTLPNALLLTQAVVNESPDQSFVLHILRVPLSSKEEVFEAERLTDHREPGLVGGSPKPLEGPGSVPCEGVGGGPRLKGPAPEHSGAGLC